MAYSVTSNRGMTGFPQEYVTGWQNYNPVQQNSGRLTGRAAKNANAAENAAYAANKAGGGGDLMSMIQQMLGGGGSRQAAQPRSIGQSGAGSLRAGRGNAAGRWDPNWQPSGGIPMQTGGGGVPSIPPATTNPQVPVGGGAPGGVTQVSSGITSGQLPDEAIQQALAAVAAGGQRGGGTGALGDMMRSNTQRNMGELSRAGSQQQADMQHAFEVARANGGLQQMKLASDTNRENVTHGVMQRNNLLQIFGQMLGGLI